MSLPLLQSQCFNCVHVRPSLEAGLPICGAFPDGIPGRILHGLYDHRYPLGGEADSSVLFKPTPEFPDGWYHQRAFLLGTLNEQAKELNKNAVGIDGRPQGHPVSAFDIQPWASGPEVLDPLSELHPGPTVIWGSDPVEGFTAFLRVELAVELAATATAIHLCQVVSELPGLLKGIVPAPRVRWVMEKYEEFFENEGGEDELGPFEEWETAEAVDWWTDNDLYPDWPPLLREEIISPALELTPDLWNVIDDEGWEHDTGEGIFYRIDDPEIVIEHLEAENIRCIHDEDLIRRAGGPASV